MHGNMDSVFIIIIIFSSWEYGLEVKSAIHSHLALNKMSRTRKYLIS